MWSWALLIWLLGGHGLVLGQQLDSILLEVFSNLMDSPKGHFQTSEPAQNHSVWEGLFLLTKTPTCFSHPSTQIYLKLSSEVSNETKVFQ